MTIYGHIQGSQKDVEKPSGKKTSPRKKKKISRFDRLGPQSK